MALVRCTSATSRGGALSPVVGELYDSTHPLVVANPASFSATVSIGTSTEAGSVKGIYLTGTIAVAVPSVAAAGLIAKVDVDISTDPLVYVAAVGDAVIAIPQEALPTNSRLQNAWVTATDSVQIVFGAETAAVTGASKNFKFMLVDLT
jgi:hypothetical protein